MKRRAFVTGWPVAHSLSPVLHAFWLDRHAIDGSYEPLARAPDEFAAFMRELPASGWAGGNVTLPHKEVALRCCDHADVDAQAIGAANTLWLKNGQVHGGNSDAYGFAANLDQRASGWDQIDSALVIGAGGAARAVVHALLLRKIARVAIINRTLARASALADQFGPPIRAAQWSAMDKAIAAADLIVNTTSLGMQGQPALDVELDRARRSAMVCDLVYVPLETPLLAAARHRGLVAVDGLGMLLHQAVPGFERWFGVRPLVDDELRAHVLAAAARRRRRT